MSVVTGPTEQASLPERSRLLPTTAARVGLIVSALLVAGTPLVIEDDFWMTVLANAGAFSIAAIGLSILTGCMPARSRSDTPRS